MVEPALEYGLQRTVEAMEAQFRLLYVLANLLEEKGEDLGKSSLMVVVLLVIMIRPCCCIFTARLPMPIVYRIVDVHKVYLHFIKCGGHPAT